MCLDLSEVSFITSASQQNEIAIPSVSDELPSRSSSFCGKDIKRKERRMIRAFKNDEYLARGRFESDGTAYSFIH